jgi:hypothetical protein
MPVIPVLRRLRQEDQEFKANLNYISRPYLKKYIDHNNTVPYYTFHILNTCYSVDTIPKSSIDIGQWKINVMLL